MKVLIVDDDRVDRELVARALKKSALKVDISEAHNVNDGIEFYKNHHVDIILLDYRMPERDGIEMILEIRSEPKNRGIAIVMMSSSEDEQLALDCIKAGAQDFLVKLDITAPRLRRAVLHAQTRFELEQQLFQSYQQVKHIAESDSLTGLANRYLFDESLKLSIANNIRTRFKLALLLIDLDDFKNVNDTYGHDVGDLLLKKVVARIKGCLRGNEQFARLGGDEFAIILSNIDTIEHSSLVAQRIVKVLEKPFEIANASIISTASIGISIHPDNGTSAEELFKYSDIAMYRSKKLGRNQACFFESEMQKQFSDRILIEQELRAAQLENQLSLCYQPVINPHNNEILGFEALLRWSVGGDTRMPDDFIPIAEETKEIIPIGRWVISEALATLSHWNKISDKSYSIAINVSPVQLSDPGLVSYLKELMKINGITPNLVEIELTETALLGDSSEAIESLTQINELGCSIALDDFGTGFSSVSHLQNFPISTIKIDKSLMPNEFNMGTSVTLMKGLVSMAKDLGLNIIAEGVETKQNKELCQVLGITKIQGYYFCKPLRREEIETRYLTKQ